MSTPSASEGIQNPTAFSCEGKADSNEILLPLWCAA